MSDERTKGQVDDSRDDDRSEARHGLLRQLIELVLTLLVAVVIAQAVRTWVVQPFVVPTGSMLPTIQLKDQVLANKFVYRFDPPKRGDIVVFDDPTGEVDTLIKRVIAVGGQTVDVHDGKVWVDGTALVEPYTHGQPSEPQVVPLPIKIPVGSIWVMGDNRTQSKDSRTLGPIPLSLVHGRAFVTYWPPDRIGVLQ